MEDTDHYRCRLIYLKPDDNPAHQATAACDALAGIDGILLAAPFDSCSIHIIYSLDKLSFELIIGLLTELGFEMDDSILISVRNTIFGFLEDNARDNMHIDVTNFEIEENESAEIPQPDSERYWKDYH
jgi:hypothetical protein